jgi:hypothetical protein
VQISEATSRSQRRERAIRLRAGIAKTFGPLFVVLSLVLVLPGGMVLHDALTHPLTADTGQLLFGSTFIAIALLVVFYLLRERK